MGRILGLLSTAPEGFLARRLCLACYLQLVSRHVVTEHGIFGLQKETALLRLRYNSGLE